MKNKKIVHIMLAGPVTDGWTYQDNMITKYHRKLGYDVTMITSRWIWGNDGKLKKYEKTQYINEDDVKVVRLDLKGKDNFYKKYKTYYNLIKTLVGEKPDILFIHNVSFGDVSKVVCYIKWNPQIKVFVDNHSDFSNSGLNWISKNILHKIIWAYNAKLLEPYTSKFYGVLPARVDWLVEMYGLPPSKCELLVMGGDDEAIADAQKEENIKLLRTKHGINADDLLIVTGGKIDSAKKQTLYLMEAIKRIGSDKLKLIVFGSVEDEIKEEVLNLADGGRIQYIGWINGSDSYKYFAMADMVVFPGRHSVYWEQVVSLGIPMICKRWDGTTHVDIGGNVIFLDEDTIEEIEKEIRISILDDKKLDLMKSAALDKQSFNFRYSEIARKSVEQLEC